MSFEDASGRRDFLKRGSVTLAGSGVSAGREPAVREADPPSLLFAVIFEVKPSATGYQDYLDIAKALRPRLDSIDGFLSIERFASQTRPGWLLSLSYWADEATLVKWRTEPSHHAAQEKGRNAIFDDYRLRVAQVVSRERGDSPSATAWSPARRSAYNDIRKRPPRAVAVIDATLPNGAVQELTTAASTDPGYLDGDVFETLPGVTPPRIVHVTSWRDEEAAMHWRQRVTTAMAAASPWQIAVAEVERDYGLRDRDAAPQYFVSVPATAAQPAGRESREEVLRIPGYPSTVALALRHIAPVPIHRGNPEGVVLFVHGATFPSALAAGFRFDGLSWMDDLSDAGFDVWALDFTGYGESDRYPEMREPADAHGPLGRADVCSRQIAEAIGFIRTRTHARAVSIIAHSWGTLPASLYTTRDAASVNRLVLFGPVTKRRPAARSRKDPLPAKEPAYAFVTIRDQHDRFAGYVPSGEAPVLDVRHFDVWAPAYLASDPASAARTPPSVQVPFGPSSDLERAWSGMLAYDPAGITCPTLIVRGEWDSVTTDADAHWLYHALSACPLKRNVTISRGTHVMHLECSRFQLYREVQTFLSGRD